jgi:MATE family multidrug resistance protein
LPAYAIAAVAIRKRSSLTAAAISRQGFVGKSALEQFNFSKLNCFNQQPNNLMRMSHFYLGLLEARQLFRLAWPVFLTQITQISMGFVDTAMSGRVSAADMAAVGLGSAIWFPVVLFGQGIILTITPAIARLSGQGKFGAIGNEMRQGLWLALFMCPILMTVIAMFSHYVTNADYEPELADKAGRYLKMIMWGVPGYLFFVTLRCTMDGLARVRLAMLVAFCGLIMNIICNSIFIFGMFGIPAYGGVGSGIASAIVCWTMFFVMLFQMNRQKDLRDWFRPRDWAAPDFAGIKRYVRIGLPNAMALLTEITMFATTAMLLAPLGAHIVAGHQVAMSFSGIVFMAPLSIGIAITIRVGTHIGEGRGDTARLAGRVGLVFGLAIACVNAVMAISFRHQIAAFYNPDSPQVQAIGAMLLLFTASFQLTDCVQVISIGILRAYNDTKAIMASCFVAYWVIALPIGYLLGRTALITAPMGASGFWTGILIGVSLVAVFLVLRLRYMERRFAAGGCDQVAAP